MSRFTDPVQAAKERIASDQRADSEFFGVLAEYRNAAKVLVKGLFGLAASPTPASALNLLPETLKALQEDAAERTKENQAYLLNAVVEKVQLHDDELRQHTDRFERLEDGLGSAFAYTGPRTPQDKLDNFAAIAVSGALVYTEYPPEQTDEFLRIAEGLQRTDVMVLREVGEAQATATKGFSGTNHILHQVQLSWTPLLRKLEQSGIQPLNYRSAFVRLQSFGLLERMEPNPGTNGLGETPYLLLELGELFLKYLADHHQKTSE